MNDSEPEFAPAEFTVQPPDRSAPQAGTLERAPAEREDDRILAEIDRLERKKSNWVTALLVLVVSGVLFYWIGLANWSWKTVALLIPILLFHELGHYVAMRAFRYRNLRMFFIPLFGAAVIGRHYNVPAWKKAVVSLMGPIPGIGVGIVLGIVALLFHHKLMLEAATLMVFLNGFNLLPILPLDGGWNLHAILFSRHVLLDTGFRLIAAVLLLVGAVYLHQQFLIYLGIVMLIALPATVRIALIAGRLRREGLAANSLDSQSIPEGTARRIIAEIRKSLPKRLNVKNYAQITLQVFESLNARPAGWFATITLAGAHLAGFAASLAAAAVFFMAGRANLWQADRHWAEMPRNDFACGTTLSWRGTQAVPADESHITLLGTFATRKKGEEAFHELTHRLPASASAMLFGQSIFLTLPRDSALREEWEAKLRPVWPDFRVLEKNSTGFVTLVCAAPDQHAAKAIEHELHVYFTLRESRHLIPSWSTSPPLTDAQRNARLTYSTLQEIQIRNYSDSRRRLLPESAVKVPRSQASLGKRRHTIDQLHRQAASVAVFEVRRGATRSTDLELVRLYEDWSLRDPDKKTHAESSKFHSQVRERMGALPVENGKPKPGVDRESTLAGLLLRSGLQLRFNWIAFKQIESGLPALADWLCAKKCDQIKYRFERFSEGQSEDEADETDF